MAIGYSAFNTPGALVPAFNGGNFTATFNNTATFTHGDGETCAAGEYRQNVKGSLSVNGSPLNFVLCATTQATLSNVFQQDGCSPPGCSAYGYRACPDVAINRYAPSRATGCNYTMQDVPGFRNVTPGSIYALDVTFQGLLVDTGTNATLVARTWTVIGAGTALAGAEALLSEVSPMNETPLFADMTRNLISKAREVHVVFRRSPGLPRVTMEGQVILLFDENDALVVAVGEPAIHEYGNLSGSTVSIVLTLPDDAPDPTTVRLSGTGSTSTTDEPLILPIRAR